MARAKSPRPTNPTEKQVITMPESTPVPQIKKTPSPVSTMSGSAPAIDLESKIRQRAYAFYEERGYLPGFEEEDWLKAEREVLAGAGDRNKTA